jgi:hypothetical protein
MELISFGAWEICCFSFSARQVIGEGFCILKEDY